MADISQIKLPNGTTYNIKDTVARTGTVETSRLARPTKLNGVIDNTIVPQIDDLRANRLAFLPADQIIIEKTTDGGSTWVDAGVSDDTKLALFSQTRPGVYIPLLNGNKSVLCGLRITITAMKYNVPSGTAETSKYNYWNSNYVLSTERYNQIREMYFWVSSNSDAIKVKVERATGANPNNWITLFDRNDYGMTGWSGNDYISFSQGVFGGGTNQTGNYWNYRITFFTCGANGSSTLSGTNTTSSQAIQEIRGYGTTWWTAGNKFAASDHMYSWDASQNVTFPNKVTATGGFAGNLIGDVTGKINNHTVNSDVPVDAKFTDTTYSSKSAASGGTDISLVTTGEKYTWNNKSNLAIGTSATTAAAGNHTHSISIATSTGTNQITLAANTKYSLTAGGQSYVFTTPPDNNTDTKVTSVGNHYAPSADDDSKLTANASGATAAWSIDVVKGISIERDAKGHVTGVSVVSGKIPGNPNTDTKNTAGSTDTSSKIFLIGATSQAVNPQTYSHDTAYVGTDGCLYSGGTKVLTAHQDISGKKNTQTAVSDPTASGTSTSFIKTISQNAQGVITPTKASLPTASTSAAGIVQLNNTLTSTSTTQALTAAQGKALNDKIDAIPTSTLRDVPFGVGTGDWTASGGNYVTTVSSTYVTTTSREWVTFDDTFRSYAKGDISVDKVSGGGGITLTTSAVPSGTIQGFLYVIDTDDGKVPVLIEGTVTPIANGGTGQSTLSGVQNTLGISILSSRVDELNSNIENHLDVRQLIATDTSSLKNGLISCCEILRTTVSETGLYTVNALIPGVVNLDGWLLKRDNEVTGFVSSDGVGYIVAYKPTYNIRVVQQITSVAL